MFFINAILNHLSELYVACQQSHFMLGITCTLQHYVDPAKQIPRTYENFHQENNLDLPTDSFGSSPFLSGIVFSYKRKYECLTQPRMATVLRWVGTWCLTSRNALFLRPGTPRHSGRMGLQQLGRGASPPAMPCSFVQRHHATRVEWASSSWGVVLHLPQ